MPSRLRALIPTSVALLVALAAAPASAFAVDGTVDPFRLDTSFNGGRALDTRLEADALSMQNAAIMDRNGNGIIFVGHAKDPQGRSRFRIRKLRGNGSADPNWGTAGVVWTTLAGDWLPIGERADGAVLLVDDESTMVTLVDRAGTVRWRVERPTQHTTGFAPAGNGALMVQRKGITSSTSQDWWVDATPIDANGRLMTELTRQWRGFSTELTTFELQPVLWGNAVVWARVAANPGSTGSETTCLPARYGVVQRDCVLETVGISAELDAAGDPIDTDISVDGEIPLPAIVPTRGMRTVATPLGRAIWIVNEPATSTASVTATWVDLTPGSSAGTTFTVDPNTWMYPFAGGGLLYDRNEENYTSTWMRIGGPRSAVRRGDIHPRLVDARGRAYVTEQYAGGTHIARVCFLDPACVGRSTRRSKVGTARANTIFGTWLDEVIRGGAGNDRLFGDGGPDVLKGEGGADRLDGGRDRDLFDGGAGNDVLLAADNIGEVVRCGLGVDIAVVDKYDKPFGCERKVVRAVS